MAFWGSRTPPAGMASLIGKRHTSIEDTTCDFGLVADGERSPKRTKVDQELEKILASPSSIRSRTSADPVPPLHDGGAVRDDTYYMSDGSCVLRVENTLFNVHRTRIARDNSVFSSMFSLPQGEHCEVEGLSDENPIVLQGDTVEEFRNFLWALYALPYELIEVTGYQIGLLHLDRLVDVARVSFKYHFKSLEAWALDVITDHVQRKPSSIFSMPLPYPHIISTLPSPAAMAAKRALISRLMRLAQLCGHDRLLSTVTAVLQELMTHSVHYAHLAMSLADELDLRALRGVAYFAVMQRGGVVIRAQGSAQNADGDAFLGRRADIDSEGRLVVSPEQKMRLMTGYYRLTHVWESLRATPLSFEHAVACGATWHQHGCTQCWLDFWKEKTKCDTVLGLGLADVLGRLRVIEREFVKWGSATYMHTDCRITARRAILEKMKEIEDALPDYFSDDGP